LWKVLFLDSSNRAGFFCRDIDKSHSSKSSAWALKVHVLIGGELSDTPENMAELGSNSS
jgi:hypothetical protein